MPCSCSLYVVQYTLKCSAHFFKTFVQILAEGEQGRVRQEEEAGRGRGDTKAEN